MQYDAEDDILVIEFNKGKIVRDVSVGWNVNVGMTENGVGEIVVLDAKAAGLFPLELSRELKAAKGGKVPLRAQEESGRGLRVEPKANGRDRKSEKFRINRV